MAKTYGGRWKTIGSLGTGGQGDVFRVVDERGAFAEAQALKRLRDVRRLDRFKNELEALKRLDDPHVIKVIDHSDLSDASPEQKHYLVMPIALGGDAERRLPLFKGNIENVVQVALQLASALGAAHRAEVIHRDVKPGNVLFPGEGLDTWLSDFGICHIDKEVRDTPSGAIMGPRRFAAPEIEAGGATDFAADVDVYSLGQLIFYLISGGRTFHRENVYATEHDGCFGEGERAELLRTLLARMVADRASRIKSMEQVSSALAQIGSWGSEAHRSVLSEETRRNLMLLGREAQENDRLRQEAITAKENRDAVLVATMRGIVSRLQVDLEEAAASIKVLGNMEASVTVSNPDQVIEFSAYDLLTKAAVRIAIGGNATDAAKCALQVRLCEKRSVNENEVQGYGYRVASQASDFHPLLALVPIFTSKPLPAAQQIHFIPGDQATYILFEYGNVLTIGVGSQPGGSGEYQALMNLTQRPILAGDIPTLEFQVSDWPDVQKRVTEYVSEMVGRLVQYLKKPPVSHQIPQ